MIIENPFPMHTMLLLRDLFGFSERITQDDAREKLMSAKVVWAWDNNRGWKSIVYGREAGWSADADPIVFHETVPSLSVVIDLNADGLGQLLRLLVSVKGSHEYEHPLMPIKGYDPPMPDLTPTEYAARKAD